jgi:hypothetical protein
MEVVLSDQVLKDAYCVFDLSITGGSEMATMTIALVGIIQTSST